MEIDVENKTVIIDLPFKTIRFIVDAMNLAMHGLQEKPRALARYNKNHNLPPPNYGGKGKTPWYDLGRTGKNLKQINSTMKSRLADDAEKQLCVFSEKDLIILQDVMTHAIKQEVRRAKKVRNNVELQEEQRNISLQKIEEYIENAARMRSFFYRSEIALDQNLMQTLNGLPENNPKQLV